MLPFVFTVVFIPSFHGFSDFFCSDSFHCRIFDRFLETAPVKYVIIIIIINFYYFTNAMISLYFKAEQINDAKSNIK